MPAFWTIILTSYEIISNVDILGAFFFLQVMTFQNACDGVSFRDKMYVSRQIKVSKLESSISTNLRTCNAWPTLAAKWTPIDYVCPFLYTSVDTSCFTFALGMDPCIP